MVNSIKMNALTNTTQFDMGRKAQRIEFLLLSITAICIPLLLGHAQFVTGTVVNAALILAALHFRDISRLLPLILLPALSAVAAGVLFGEVVWGLVALIPVIWAGNFALVAIMKGLYLSKKINYFSSLITAGIVKSAIILGGVAALIALGALPAVFLSVMVPLQIITVLLGGGVAWPANEIIRDLNDIQD